MGLRLVIKSTSANPFNIRMKQVFFYVVSNCLKRLLAVIAASMILTGADAQIMPVHSLKSPDAGNLGLYGNVPVGLYTGVPEISIPLYNLQVGEYTMPVSLSYHLQSVKTDNIPGYVGTGWTLHAGGQITRTVRGMMDERETARGNKAGYYYHSGEMTGVENDHNLFKTLTTQHYIDGDGLYEMTTDEYSFNFCGYSGSFYLSADGKWTVVSDDDIKVVSDSITGKESVKKQLGNFRNMNKISDYSVCFFHSFVLLAPDGCRYEFGGTDAIEYSTSYYNRHNTMFAPTAWKLKKITTVSGHVIDFSYKRGINCNITFAPQKIEVTINGDTRNVKTHENTGYSGYTGFLLYPVFLEEIRADNVKICFDSKVNTIFNNRMAENSGLYWGNNIAYTQNMTYVDGVFESPYTQFEDFLPDGCSLPLSSSVSKIRIEIARYLSNHLLKDMKVYNSTNNNVISACHFDYDNSSRALLDSLRVNDKRYAFSYNPCSTDFKSFSLLKSDSWGYFSGTKYKLSDYKSFYVNSPNEQSTKEGTLKKIVYPTGGSTGFEYELNSYSQCIDDTHTSIKSQSGVAGGLRVKSITDYDLDGAVILKKAYFYAQEKTGKSSGILKHYPNTNVLYNLSGEGNRIALKMYAEGGFYNHVADQQSPDVGYSYVWEQRTDGAGICMGSTRYHYSNFGDGLFEEAPLTATISDKSVFFPYTSHSRKRGKLLEEEIYDGQDQLLQRTLYTYKEVCNGSFLCGNQLQINAVFGNNPQMWLTCPVGWLTKVYTYSYLPGSITTETFGMPSGSSYKEMCTFDYNDYRLKSRETIANGSLDFTTLYTYPAAGSRLYNAHILTPVLSKKKCVDGDMIEEDRTDYQMKGTVPFIKKCETVYPDMSQRKTNYEVTLTDQYGNPVEYLMDEVYHVALWTHHGQSLLAIIDNVRLSDILPDGTDADAIDRFLRTVTYEDVLEKMKALPAAHFEAYRYDNCLRLAEITRTGFLQENFYYDEFGRLIESGRDNLLSPDYQVLKTYMYHYNR